MTSIPALANELVRHGLQYAFGVTGSGPSLDLISALEEKGVRYFPAAHEAAAAIMAGAVARTTGRLSASISVKGPGLANMIPGIACNSLEGIPALSLSEAFGADAPAWRRHKRLPHDRMVSGLVKTSLGLEDLGSLGQFLELARAEAPGPIHLDLCRKGAPAALPPDPPAPLPSTEPLARIERASRPAAVVGSLALRRPWGRRLARLRVPVFTTVAAKGAVDERGAFAAGVLTGDGKERAPETTILAEADLVVGLGLRNTEVLTPRRWAGSTVIVDEAAGLADGFQADVACAPAAPSAFDGILDALERKAWGEQEVRAARERLRGSMLDGSWLPAAGFEALNTLPYPHGLVLDTGYFCTVGEHLWAAGKDREFLASANGRYMGTSLPMALGLSAARPGLPVVCVAGDGGLRMHVAELRLAEAERLPVCVVLMSDGRYGSVAEPARGRAFSRRAVEIARPSWRAAVEGMGLPAADVGSAEAFRRTLEAWDRSGPLYVEARFDPEAYGAMTRGLR